jgi:hypothetical protein
MSVDPGMLESKIREMYPDINKYGFDLSLNFNEQKDAWIVDLKHGQHELTTHLERKDAEACLEGVQCVYFGIQVAQFVKNFEAKE